MAGAVLTVVAPTTVDVPAGPALRDALDDGRLAVLVGDPARFWAIDPVSGATISVFEPGVRWSVTFGRNGVNAVLNTAARTVVDPRNGNRIFENGKYYRPTRPPPSRCSGANEYLIVGSCVSIPASVIVGMQAGVFVTAVVSWSLVFFQILELIAR